MTICQDLYEFRFFLFLFLFCFVIFSFLFFFYLICRAWGWQEYPQVENGRISLSLSFLLLFFAPSWMHFSCTTYAVTELKRTYLNARMKSDLGKISSKGIQKSQICAISPLNDGRIKRGTRQQIQSRSKASWRLDPNSTTSWFQRGVDRVGSVDLRNLSLWV